MVFKVYNFQDFWILSADFKEDCQLYIHAKNKHACIASMIFLQVLSFCICLSLAGPRINLKFSTRLAYLRNLCALFCTMPLWIRSHYNKSNCSGNDQRIEIFLVILVIFRLEINLSEICMYCSTCCWLVLPMCIWSCWYNFHLIEVLFPIVHYLSLLFIPINMFISVFYLHSGCG